MIAENYARIFRQNMFNCGMLAIELPAETIDLLFKRFGGKSAEARTDFQNSRLIIGDGAEEEIIPFALSEFDRKLVIAGGWVDYADTHY